MHHTSQDSINEDRMVSRRKAIKTGFAAAIGAAATIAAARSGGAAVTPLDVKRPGFTTFRAPAPTTVSTEETSGE